MTLNFNLIRKTKLTKVFKLFLEKRYLKFKSKAINYFYRNRKNRKHLRKKKFKKKRKVRYRFYVKRKKKLKLKKKNLINYYKKQYKKYIKYKNKFYKRRNNYEKQRWKENWAKRVAFKLKMNYFNINNLKIFNKKKKLSFLRKKRYFKRRRYFLYLVISASYSWLKKKLEFIHFKKKLNSSKKWLRKNKSYSMYMPEAKKNKMKARKKKSNWWKLRLLNKKVALYYGFRNLKKFRYIFNFYEKGMDFSVKTMCRLEIMLNMLMLSLSFVDNVMTSNNFVRSVGVNINGVTVNYPFRVVKKNSIISFEKTKFKKLYSIIKNRFKRDKTYILTKFRKSSIIKERKIEKHSFKKIYKDVIHERESKRRNTQWYLKAIREGAAKLIKAKKILKRLENILERITQNDINFFYGIKQNVYYYYKYNKTFDGRFLLKRISVLRNVPKYIECNFKILHFILWNNPNNSQIAKLYKRNHSLHGWNFSTQIENN